MPKPRSLIDPLAASMTDDVIFAMGAQAPRQRIAGEVAARCAVHGVVPPVGRSLGVRIARHAWKADSEPGGGIRLVLDQAHLHQPIWLDGGVTHPIVTLAFLDPSGIIVAHRMDPPMMLPSLAGAKLLAAIAIRETAHAPPIVTRMPTTVKGGWADLHAVARNAGIDVAGASTMAGRAGLDIQLVLGRWLGRLRIGLRPRGTPGDCLDQTTVEGMIAEAVALHNRRRDRACPPFTLSRNSADEMTRALEAFISHHSS